VIAKLFDDVARTDLAPASHGEPHFPYLNRSGRPYASKVREVLEEWFVRYPADGQSELRTRFRSAEDRTHSAAFFELYVHELLVRQGNTVTLHPVIPTGAKRPDFLVETAGGERFYCEATVAFDASHTESAGEKRLNDLRDALNKVDSPNFFIELNTDGVPVNPLPLKDIRRQVAEFLASLDPDAIAAQLTGGAELQDLPAMSLTFDGILIDVRGLPKSPGSRGKEGVRSLGVISTEGGFVDDAAAPRDAAIRKAAKYGDLDLPFLIAVNAPSQHLDRIDIMEALFGKESYAMSPDMKEPRLVRQPNGLWHGPKGQRYTRVSGVMLVSSLVPSSVGVAMPWLILNPWAKKPLPDAFPLISTGRAIQGATTMDFVERASGEVIFGLQEGWLNLD
jgi:hypothetical protein